MADDQLTRRLSAKTALAEWTNVINRVISGDLFSRNESGVVADLAGNLGNSAYRWLNGWLIRLNLVADTGADVQINAPTGLVADYTLTMFAALAATGREVRMSGSGELVFEEDWVKSGLCENHAVVDDINFEDVTNLSVQVEVNSGEKIIFVLLGAGNTDSGAFGHLNYAFGSPSRGQSTVRLQRAGASAPVADCSIDTVSNVTDYSIAPFLVFYDAPSVGSHSYQIQARGAGLAFKNCILIALKL